MKFKIKTVEQILGLYLTSGPSFRETAEKERWSLIRGEYDLFSRTALMIKIPVKPTSLQNISVANYYQVLINNPIISNYLQTQQDLTFNDIQEHILMSLWERLHQAGKKSVVITEVSQKFLDNIYYLYRCIKENGCIYNNDYGLFDNLEPQNIIDGFEIKYLNLEDDIVIFFRLWSNFRSPIKLLSDLLVIFKDHLTIFANRPNFINQDILLACIVTDNILSKFD